MVAIIIRVMARKSPKAACNCSFCWLENIWKFMTWQPQTLYSWNLPQLCIPMRPFIWQKIGAWLIRHRKAWLKNLWKEATKWVFWPNFDHFFRTEQKLSNIWCITWHCISGQNFKQIWPNFMGLHPRNQKTDLQIQNRKKKKKKLQLHNKQSIIYQLLMAKYYSKIFFTLF